jgi:cyclopropane fatty-acyl-phospholipid synthase-like methyltransferase
MTSIGSTLMGSSIREKLKAWWHGYELDDADADGSAPKRAAVLEEDPVNPLGEPGEGDWSEGRLLSLQRLFGDGNDAPEAYARTSTLIKPLGIKKEMSVLEIGAGLGVGLRVVANDAGAYIDAIEPEPALVEQATRFVSKDGLQKLATPTTDDIFSDKIQRIRRDVIISRDAMHRMPDRDALLAGIFKLLKGSGQFLMTDLMANRQADQSQLIAWLELHENTPNLWDMAEARNQLKTMGMDVRVAKDESDEYCDYITGAIKRFAANLKREPIEPDLREWMMWEVEYWARTVSAIQSGALRHCRIHAVAPYEDPMKNGR